MWIDRFSGSRKFGGDSSGGGADAAGKKKAAPSGTASVLSGALALFDDFRNDAGADGAAAFADREAQFLFHRDRRDQFDGNSTVPVTSVVRK
jgi:hypothetical protein